MSSYTGLQVASESTHNIVFSQTWLVYNVLCFVNQQRQRSVIKNILKRQVSKNFELYNFHLLLCSNADEQDINRGVTCFIDRETNLVGPLPLCQSHLPILWPMEDQVTEAFSHGSYYQQYILAKGYLQYQFF